MIYDVSQQKLVLQVAKELKNIIKMPDWANFVKTGSHRETMPKNHDWWYIRAASILRMCHSNGPVGVNKLRTKYGGRKNRGMKPDQFRVASGKVIRVILQQLQQVDLVKEHTVANRKGRVITPKGMSLLIKSAKQVMVDSKNEPEHKKAKKVVLLEGVDYEAESKEEAKKPEHFQKDKTAKPVEASAKKTKTEEHSVKEE